MLQEKKVAALFHCFIYGCKPDLKINTYMKHQKNMGCRRRKTLYLRQLSEYDWIIASLLKQLQQGFTI